MAFREETIAAAAGELWLEAAHDPTLLPQALQAMADGAGARGVLLMTTPQIIDGMPVSTEFSEIGQTYYRQGWHENDYRADHGMRLTLRRGIVVDQDFATLDVIKRVPLYQDFLARFRLQWFAAIHFSFDQRSWALSLQRTVAQGPFLAREQAALLKYRRSLAAGARIAVMSSRLHALGMVQGLEAIGEAAAVLDWTGSIVEHNSAFAALPADTIRIRAGRPVAIDHASQKALNAAISLAQRFDPRRPSEHSLVPLRRPNGSALLARSVPVTHRRVLGLGSAATLLLIRDPIDARAPTAWTLQQAFGLTPAESRLAEALLAGGRLEDVALRLGVKLETVRSQLKAIFDKTGTRRQTDLIGLLSRLI